MRIARHEQPGVGDAKNGIDRIGETLVGTDHTER
jgi:hypothetical protein